MSNVIKPHAYVSVKESLRIKSFINNIQGKAEPPEGSVGQSSVQEHPPKALLEAEQMLADAALAAEEQLRMALEETIRLREEAAAEIDAWWDQRRIEDLRVVEESRQSGFESGYRDGLEKAQQEMHLKYEALIKESAQLIKESYQIKQAIIAEAEPFLVELSLGIARKIIGNHLDTSPEWTIGHVKKILERRREKGIITLCTAPSEFLKLQDAREELQLSLDSQAELNIVPDSTVMEGGCVVRTSFGSIDARIDTQLAEIKSVLLEIANVGDEERGEQP